MEIVLTAVAAAVIGACGPLVMRRLPEPPEPDDDKVPYADLTRPRGLMVGLGLAGAVLGAIVAWGIDLPELLPAWALVCGVGVWLSYIDWHTRLLPYLIVAPLYLSTWVLVGLAAVLAGDRQIALSALIANVVVFVAFWLLYRVGRLFRGGGLGYGDVRLAAVLALVLGPLGLAATLVGLYAGFLLGALLGLLLSALRIVDRRGFAFGPYMVAGAVVGAVWGPRIYGA